MRHKKILFAISLVSLFTLSFQGFANNSLKVVRAEDGIVDVIASSNESNWTEVNEKQGTWTKEANSVSVDAFGGAYTMDGAVLVSDAAKAYGAYEYSANIKINELNKVENPMVGIVPWFIDKDNFLTVNLKYSWANEYQMTPEEKADGYGLEEIIISGRYNGEAKYYTATSQQENTTFNAKNVAVLKNTKKNPLNADGHTIAVKFENNSATATSYKVSVSYDGTEVASTYAYFYNAVALNNKVGFMAQDVKATFSNVTVNDYYQTNNTAALARDWRHHDEFIYRTLNGVDSWTFNDDESISFITDEVKEGKKTASTYKVSGSNIAGYDTNRGFKANEYATTSEGLPQNYEISASFKLDEELEYKGKTLTQGFGLIPWYKDDQNFVDVMFRQTYSGLQAAPTITKELVLCGWIECSNQLIGETVYTLPQDFDFSQNHKITVAKKSTGFYVHLDDSEEPVISKIVRGTGINYNYGYEGYNAKFTGSKISNRIIYNPYDEISILDDAGIAWNVSGASKDAWNIKQGVISLNAKEEVSAIGKESYIIGASDISDKNVTLEIDANIARGNSSQMSELLLAPFFADENNYAKIGLVFKGGKTLARVKASTWTEEDQEEELMPTITALQTEIANVNDGNIKLKAEKIDNVLSLYVNDNLVYNLEIPHIDIVSKDFAIYAYNMDLTINKLDTIGYKKYDQFQVGDWLTSGMKYNEWTINESGYLIGDGTYSKEMEHEEDDSNMNFAIKENPYATQGLKYTMEVDLIAIAQSEAEDRVGVMMWYLDKDNFIYFYLDRWRADSTVPRTTIYGKFNGETLPTTYNHGGWLKEGDNILDSGLTQTEASQVTEWHTLHITVDGDNFTCYIDTESNGYISYTVAAGLTPTNGAPVYSGLYTFNDAIMCRRYDIYGQGETAANALPCPENNPYDAKVIAPEIGTYNATTFTDEFENGDIENPDDSSTPTISESESTSKIDSSTNIESSSKTEENSQAPTDNKKKGCKGDVSTIGSLIALLSLGGIALIKKNKKEEEK